jgi:hypothetical protein
VPVVEQVCPLQRGEFDCFSTRPRLSVDHPILGDDRTQKTTHIVLPRTINACPFDVFPGGWHQSFPLLSVNMAQASSSNRPLKNPKPPVRI